METTRFCWLRTSAKQLTIGATTSWCDPSIEHPPSRLRHRMAICDGLVAAIRDPSFDQKPAVEQCAIHIQIAVILLHELAHCLHRHRHRDFMLLTYDICGVATRPPEPSVRQHFHQELGYMFEISLFGGVVRAGHDTTNISKGLVVEGLRFDGSEGLELRMPATDCSEQVQGYKISDSSILSLMHEDTWRPRANVPLYLIPMLATSIPAPGMNDNMLTSVFAMDQVPVTRNGWLINSAIPAYRSASISADDQTTSQQSLPSQSNNNSHDHYCK